MNRFLRWAVILGVILLVVVGVGASGGKYWQDRQRVNYRDAEVTRGRIVTTVSSTGTVKPKRSVQVGSFVSGPIKDIFVDFNDEVKEGQILATIDPQLYEANVARDEAILATRLADVERVKAQLGRARNDERRSIKLREENVNFISDAEMDQFKFARMSLDAELVVADKSVSQARASLDNSKTNLEYTKIKAPENGVIIDRKIDPGQTVQSQFTTPELFILAIDMRKAMHVFASVDEADIGLIRKAQETKQPVRFTVDAYPDDLFVGEIFQIRKNSTTTQNVVTYPVVVAAPNPDLKLMPGMTASLSFQVAAADSVLRIPNSALRFYPPLQQVRPEDRHLLENAVGTQPSQAQQQESEQVRSAEQKAETRRKRNRRHVWVVDGQFLRAVEVVTGLSDHEYTELVSGEIGEGQRLVTGVQPR